jgi:hypothetical protein
MHTHQIKLALTAGLLNNAANDNFLATIHTVMSDFVHEAGTFLGLRQQEQTARGSLTNERYDLCYEHATISLEIVRSSIRDGAAVRRLEVN